ncbi:MAG: Sjogren's syndrome/scleroderma autoantigen 1 family protein [Candidatus Heimdallarchaeaceae archaeon]
MNKSNDSDASIKAGADLLLKGWKMLNKACPDCVEPLYEKDGKVVCVKCKKQYIMVDSAVDIPQKNQSNQAPNAQTPSSSLPNSVSSFDFSSLPPALVDTAKIMLSKISDLNTMLKETNDPKVIAELSSSIRSLVDSLRSLTS